MPKNAAKFRINGIFYDAGSEADDNVEKIDYELPVQARRCELFLAEWVCGPSLGRIAPEA